MTEQLAPLKIVCVEAAEPFVQDGKALVNLAVRTITINSVSFWRDEAGTLFLRGWDEEKLTTVDLPAANVRFV